MAVCKEKPAHPVLGCFHVRLGTMWIMLSQQRPIKTTSPEATGQSPHDGTPARPGPAHILYAENDADCRLCFAEFLRRTGYAVTAVNDGRQAWKTLQKAEYDLLITDNDIILTIIASLLCQEVLRVTFTLHHLLVRKIQFQPVNLWVIKRQGLTLTFILN